MRITVQNLDLDAVEAGILDGDYPEHPYDIILYLIAEIKELKGKKKMGMLPKSLGSYRLDKSTPRFHVYTRENDQGIRESLYIYKGHFANDEVPKEIEFFMAYKAK